MKCSNPDCNCIIFHEDEYNKVKKNIIEDEELTDISNYLKVLADFTRLKIVEAVSYNELCVCDIGHLLGLTKSALSHQMRLLREHKIVKSTKKGKMVYYELDESFPKELIDLVRNYLGGNK